MAKLATLVIIALGTFAVLAVLTVGSRRAEKLVKRFAPGADTTALRAVLGPPYARCTVGSLAELEGGFPPGTPLQLQRAMLGRMQRETARRWLYRTRGVTPTCVRARGATEVGIEFSGRVLWYVPVAGRSDVVVPAAWLSETPAP